MNHLKDLNEKQKEAVLHTKGPLLILAGAGAGKTKTISHRILHLIKEGVAPHSILAITFTNKAGKELRERVHKLIETDPELNLPISHSGLPFVSTFHSLGVHILKENAQKLGYTRHFTIYDRADSLSLIKDAIKSLGLDPDQYEPGKMLHMISWEKGEGKTLSEYQSRTGSNYFAQAVAGVWLAYETALKKENALDFDDLLLKTAELLSKHADVRAHYQKIWQYIHIDEYQDTNKVQYSIAKNLTSEAKNICVVGDIDQTIYSWRGADISHILHFEKDFTGAKSILLEQNYRSTKTILLAANQIIKKNKVRVDKNLFTENGDGEQISLFVGYSERDEAHFIATQSAKIIASGVLPEHIAVLYRANFQSRVLEEAFLTHGVPYQVLGTKFFDRKEVKDVISFIRAAQNPESLADIKRVINVPARGIGKTTILKIFSGQKEGLPPTMRAKVDNFYKLLVKIKEKIDTDAPSRVIKFVLTESGLEKELSEGTTEEKERLENVRELATLATKYDIFPQGEGIEKLIEEAALATDQDSLTKNESAVKLMTVHASKGLEFEYVFVTGLEADLFPHKKIGTRKVSSAEEEEERRLFYVAITRAKKKLFLSYADTRMIFGSQMINVPSEFVTDIDSGLIHDMPRQSRWGGGQDDTSESIVYL